VLTPSPFFDFLAQGLQVSYCGAAEPQLLQIELHLAAPDPTVGAPARVRMLMEAINAGAAGGALFAPWAGAARLVSGPPSSPDPATWDRGPAYRWTLEVAGVSPVFLRLAVPVLAFAAAPIPVRTLAIIGARRGDQEQRPVTAAQVATWLHDATTHPGAWPALPFELCEAVVPRGCALRVRFEDEASEDVWERLNEVLASWALLSVGCPSLARDGLGSRSLADALGVNRREYSRFIQDWGYAQDFTSALLVNMLARFHHDVAPIARLDLRMP
jgi:hypothetical protein